MPPETSGNRTPSIIKDRYRLEEMIGRGGAGVVWRGRDELLERPVAVKEILVSLAGAQHDRDTAKARVLREARALAKLNSPAIVAVHDVVEEADRHWIVMELVDAESLGEVIRTHGPLPPAQVAAIGLALVDALSAAHEKGVLHRDVKPGNVLLGRDGRVRLTDFGIAATEGDVTLTGTGALVGSPAYIAPERIRGSSGSPASDLWGLGATLYSAVEGSPPYEGPETYAVLTAVVEGRRQPFRNAGPLRSLLSDLLDKPAEERPTAEEIRQRLIPIARNTEPVPASVINGSSARASEPAEGADGDGLENVRDATGPRPPARGSEPAEAATAIAPTGLEPDGVPDPAVMMGDRALDFAPSDELAGLIPVTEETAIAPGRGGSRFGGSHRSSRPGDSRLPLVIAAAAGAIVLGAAIAVSILLTGRGGDDSTTEVRPSVTPSAPVTVPSADWSPEPTPTSIEPSVPSTAQTQPRTSAPSRPTTTPPPTRSPESTTPPPTTPTTPATPTAPTTSSAPASPSTSPSTTPTSIITLPTDFGD